VSELEQMPTSQSIVEEVRGLLLANLNGQLNRTQFETQRSTLLMSAEADLIHRREVLLSSIASGEISGLGVAESRAEMSRLEDALREAASLAGLTKAASRNEARVLTRPPDPPVEPDRRPRLLDLEEEPTLEFVKVGRPNGRGRLISLERPEVRFLARRVGAVLPSVSGAVIFSPIGVLILAGRLEGWMPIWGIVLLLLSVGCGFSARERWQNPGPG
jgi:hypothetical protein